MPSHGNPTVDGGNLVETKFYPGNSESRLLARVDGKLF